MKDEGLNIGVRVSKNTIIGNFILAFIKILIGFIARSTAMVADGMHSLSRCSNNNRSYYWFKAIS